MSLSVRPASHYLSSLAGNPSTRQTSCAFENHRHLLSRNRGELNPRSVLLVFKLFGVCLLSCLVFFVSCVSRENAEESRVEDSSSVEAGVVQPDKTDRSGSDSSAGAPSSSKDDSISFSNRGSNELGDGKTIAEVPVAVPVLSKEEAEVSNVEAKKQMIANREKTEPFYSLYCDDDEFGKIVIEGTVRAVSAVPDPQSNDYPDCLYTVFVEVNSFRSANTREEEDVSCESELIIDVPIMKDFSILEKNIFLPDDMISCECAVYEEMPQGIRELQLSDDIQSFEHQQYYPIAIKKIPNFSSKRSEVFSKRKKTILPIQSVQRDNDARKKRDERIQNEISRIEAELKKHGGSFDAWKKEYESISEKYKKLCDQKYSVWVNDSFFSAGGRGGTETKYDTKSYIDGILPYKKYLEDNNIDLIVVRIPSRGDFAARVLASDDFQENPAWVKHYYECLKNDIEIIDPMPEMWRRRFDYQLFYFFQNEDETHPHEGTIMSAAHVLSTVLERYGISRKDGLLSLRETLFRADESVHNNFQYLFPPGNKDKDPEKPMSFHQVIDNASGKFLRLRDNTSSPFLFVSNSFFGERNMRDYGASLPHYAAYLLQSVPAWNFQSAMHNSMLRNIISQPGKLDHRKALITVGHPDDWGKGFPVIPKYLLDNASFLSLEKDLDFSSPDILFSTKNDKVILQKKDNGSAVIMSETDRNEFAFEIAISPSETQKNCMIRFNFGQTQYSLSVKVFDSDAPDEPIDRLQLSTKNNIADFFVPVKADAPVTLRFEFLINLSSIQLREILTVKSIELWYY